MNVTVHEDIAAKLAPETRLRLPPLPVNPEAAPPQELLGGVTIVYDPRGIPTAEGTYVPNSGAAPDNVSVTPTLFKASKLKFSMTKLNVTSKVPSAFIEEDATSFARPIRA